MKIVITVIIAEVYNTDFQKSVDPFGLWNLVVQN